MGKSVPGLCMRYSLYVTQPKIKYLMFPVFDRGIAHSYQYSFNPNPSWSAFYAPAREICAYLNATAEKYGVTRYVKTNHKVMSANWDDSLKKWWESSRSIPTSAHHCLGD